MGRIYRDAELTIAATGAVNEPNGCFMKRSPSIAAPVPLPDGLMQNQVSVGMCPWIMQEWMIWACRESVESEDGETVFESDERLLIKSLEESRPEANVRRGADEELMASKLSFYSNWCNVVCVRSQRPDADVRA